MGIRFTHTLTIKRSDEAAAPAGDGGTDEKAFTVVEHCPVSTQLPFMLYPPAASTSQGTTAVKNGLKKEGNKNGINQTCLDATCLKCLPKK